MTQNKKIMNDTYWEMIAELPPELINEKDYWLVQEWENEQDRIDHEKQLEEGNEENL